MKFFALFSLALVIAVASGRENKQNRLWVPLDDKTKVAENVFVYFTPSNFEVVYFPLKDFQYLLDERTFNKSLPTVVYMHGWYGAGEEDYASVAVRKAYMDAGGYNVLTLDWSHYAQDLNYLSGLIPQLKIIAEAYAESLHNFINNGYDHNLIHLVGHSLGGQMSGMVGRKIQQLSYGKIILPRIVALDPAGLLFEESADAISKSDAVNVQIIHSNGGRMGMQRQAGTIDFYPNGGTSSPGCQSTVAPDMMSIVKDSPCDHNRAWEIYQWAVRYPKAFPAVRCNSWDDFLNNGTCFRDEITYVGLDANLTATGKYYFETNANEFSLARGMAGTRHIVTKKRPLSAPVDMDRSLDESANDEKVDDKVQSRIFF